MRLGGRLALLCSWLLACGFAAPAGDINQQLAQRLHTVHLALHTTRQRIIQELNQRFDIDYEALRVVFEPHDRLVHQQLAMLEQIEDATRRQQEQQRLQAIATAPEYRRYTEARLLLDDELARHQVFRAQCVQEYQAILDTLIETDPLLRYFFRSSEYKQRWGLLLARVAWEVRPGESAVTKPLSSYTVFADQAHVPFLITVSPAAFSSLAFLRSIVIHELNHVLLFKAPRAELFATPSSAEESLPTQPVPAWYGLFFNLRHGKTPAYQYYLVHEYYAFRAQLAYDDRCPHDPLYRLSHDDRTHIERLCDWAYQQLSQHHRTLVDQSPDPSILPYLQ